MNLTVARFLHDGRLGELFQAELPDRDPAPDHPSLLRSCKGQMVFQVPSRPKSDKTIRFAWWYVPEACSGRLTTCIQRIKSDLPTYANSVILSGLQAAQEPLLLNCIPELFPCSASCQHFDLFGLDARPMLLLMSPDTVDRPLHAWTWADLEKSWVPCEVALAAVHSVLAVRFLRELYAAQGSTSASSSG